jgi:hypothetical protein
MRNLHLAAHNNEERTTPWVKVVVCGCPPASSKRFLLHPEETCLRPYSHTPVWLLFRKPVGTIPVVTGGASTRINHPTLVHRILRPRYFRQLGIDLSWHRPITSQQLSRRPTMEKHTDSPGPIRRELPGKACPFCGGKTYQLVLRTTGITNESALFVRCRQCGHPRNLDTDFKSILWI